MKILIVLDFLICGSRLFHSFIVEGKTEFSKKLCFVRIWGIIFELREKYLVFGEGTSWKRYLDDWLLIILNKQQSFLYQRLCWRIQSLTLVRVFLWKFLFLRPWLLMQHCIELIWYLDEMKCYMVDHRLCLHNQDEAF